MAFISQDKTVKLCVRRWKSGISDAGGISLALEIVADMMSSEITAVTCLTLPDPIEVDPQADAGAYSPVLEPLSPEPGSYVAT